MTLWRLDAGAQTLALASRGGVPFVSYWGARLPSDEDLSALAASTDRDLTGGMLDRLPELSLCPSGAWQGQPGIMIEGMTPRFAFDRAEGGEGSLTLVSRAEGLELRHEFRALPTGLIAAATELRSDAPVRVLWLAAPVLPGPQLADEILDFHGKWIGELQLVRTPWTPGIRMRESRTGRSGQEHPPYAIFPERGCTNTAGAAYGLHYAWPGGHRMLAEELPDGRRQVQFGAPLGAERPAKVVRTADLLLACSATGLNGIGAAFQADIRDRVVPWPDRTRPRPVHYNCWEAVYFDHRLDTLSEIAEKAAALGVDRFVLDDGWFGRRDDDRSSLGDWTVYRKRWPDGLHPLIAKVQSLGMTFGLWVEPEMVNPDSDLYRAHPDWALGPVDQTLGRHQMVLDLSQAPVRDYLFGALDALLREYDIDYFKWDHNRLLPVVDADQARGILDLLARLRAAHPSVEIESCASGGGRIDAGILSQTHRVWLSDCIDAVERLRMQHDAALVIPACVTGSHVGATHAHTTGRALPMAFRAWVAAQRHFGFEMDLRKLSPEDAMVLAEVTAWWKANRDWMMSGTILRLDSADPAVTAEMQVSAGGERFVLFAGQGAMSAQILPRPLRLTGLDPDARYRLTLKNPGDKPPQSRGPCALKDGPLTLSGRALMGQGVQLPVAWPATMWVVEGVRL